jgi:hypothetical protein
MLEVCAYDASYAPVYLPYAPLCTSYYLARMPALKVLCICQTPMIHAVGLVKRRDVARSSAYNSKTVASSTPLQRACLWFQGYPIVPSKPFVHNHKTLPFAKDKALGYASAQQIYAPNLKPPD